MGYRLLGTEGYPHRFQKLGQHAPRELFFEGTAWDEERPCLAIVGSRRASEAGRRWAFAAAVTAAERGFGVVSGGALGIDAAAHRGCLRGKAPTCVVLPTPLSRPTPQRNLDLFRKVTSSGGTVMSEYRTARGKAGFSLRNRLIAALSDRVLVVEARERSGTRHTLHFASKLGIPCFAVRWPPSDPRGHGYRDLDVHFIDGIPSLFEQPGPKPPPRPNLLLELLDRPKTLDELLELEPNVETLLFEWELDGSVERVGGRYRRRL